MKVKKFEVQGPLFIEVNAYRDERGFFSERFKQDAFREFGIPSDDFVQDNFSRSAVGVLRGLHYQFDLAQGKLVTALRGKIFDVAVDIRKASPTYGKSVTVELDGETPAWFWVPAGFAHGFLVTSEEGADVMYKVNAPYNPKGEAGLVWNDPDLAINWPTIKPSLSPKDIIQSKWADYIKAPKF